jgi:hypothetical protein
MAPLAFLREILDLWHLYCSWILNAARLALELDPGSGQQAGLLIWAGVVHQLDC